MLASSYGKECDDYSDWNATGKATPEDKFKCGSSVAYVYFISFYMICAFLVSFFFVVAVAFSSNFLNALLELSL